METSIRFELAVVDWGWERWVGSVAEECVVVAVGAAVDAAVGAAVGAAVDAAVGVGVGVVVGAVVGAAAVVAAGECVVVGSFVAVCGHTLGRNRGEPPSRCWR